MRPEEVRLGLSYRCWMHSSAGKIMARFVPDRVNGPSSVWGPIFIGTVYLSVPDDRRKSDVKIENQRFFADELEQWALL